ncbi:MULTISPECIES: cation diffusion facilitator family transporter [Caulobacter]|jgi:cobalt-zinc-cadmium efflux system protein|uniref:cation diffusion facilitator family transporter n=1 Tax=Caulobacter TaxID=75 RepID=UPI000783CF9D|nr:MULTISPECIES: cation diffusion facilitator family transporter [Caulobacter]ATC24369.1 cation transporter [Caulobacter vibrioides]MBQ1561709.1 cation transporter [Caulobacter sp.]MCK5909037.1 cation transporter [Caulobacter sp.]PIB97082.1 cation transporter [Caulobacter sp. X]
MGAGHDHGASNANAKTLGIALGLTTTFLVAEVVAGLVFNSLALLSDAAHMFTDAAALAIALAAIRVGRRKPTDSFTFGYRRFEILAAAFNAILLFAVALYVLVEGIKRIVDPEPVQSTGMLIVAVLGLIINLIAMRLLSSHKDKSLNVKGAYLEVWADMLGSLGVIAGAIIIRLTGWRFVDPIVAIGIGLWVLPRTWILLKDTTRILLEGAPPGLTLAAVRKAITQTPGVAGAHELHVWTTGADEAICTVHIVLADGADGEAVRQAVATRLEADYDLHHVTIQTEAHNCQDGAGGHA